MVEGGSVEEAVATALGLVEAGRFDEAQRLAESILTLDPDHAVAWRVLGVTMSRQAASADRARAAFERAAAIDPSDVQTWINLSVLHWQHDRIDAAEDAARSAIAHDPRHAFAHWHLATVLLARGNYGEGWSEYEWRWKAKSVDGTAYTPPWPVWSGQPIAGRQLLIYCEQGFGDMIQFMRLVPRAAARGARVTLMVPSPLKRLARMVEGVHQLVSDGDTIRQIDLQVPLMSLPHRLGLEVGTVGTAKPYLAADPALIPGWAARFAGLSRPRIGLCWQGGRDHSVDKVRSIRLAMLKPILSAIPAAWVSLQKEDDHAEIAGAGLDGQIRSIAGELGNFADTAAAIENLDLVISVDTSVAHLAGAIGKPVWLMIPTPADYRWLLDRQDSPWYPRHRLFRQRVSGDWEPVIEAVASALRARRWAS